LVLGGIAAAFCAQLAHGQALADKIPGDAVVYVGWAGADALKAKSADTHFRALMNESRVSELFGTYLDQVEAMVVKQEPKAAEPFRLVRSIGAPLWKYPTALYVGQVDATEKKEPKFTIALLTQAGDKADSIAKDINNLIPESRPGQPRASAYAQDGLVTIILSNDGDRLDSVKGTLAQTSGFANGLKQVKADGLISFYFDFQAMVSSIEAGVETHADEYAPKVKSFLDASGLRGLKQVVASAGFEGKDWVEESFVAIDSDRTGLLKAMPAGPFDTSLLKGVPATASIAAAFRFDPAVLTGELRNTLAKTDETALQFYNYGFGGLQQALGVNVEQAILAPLGTDWVAYGAPEIGSGGILGMVLVNKLDDAAAMKKGLTTVSFNLTRWANIAISKANLDIPLSVKSAKIKIGDAEISYLAMPIFAPSWAVDDGKLYIGLYPQTVGSAIRQAHSGKPSLADSDKFTGALKTLKHEKLDSFAYYDLPTGARHGAMYDNLLLIGRYLGAADLFAPPLPEPMVPPIDILLDHIAPAASGTWTDAAGTHSRNVQSFPGATMFHGDSSALTGVFSNLGQIVAVMGPAMNRARESATRVQSMSNLRQIGMATMMYATDNDGQLPPSFAPLVVQQQVAAQVFDNPGNGPLAIPNDIANDPEALSQFVAEHSDYIYLGEGLLMRNMTAETVLAYENPETAVEGINILFGDGHVEFLMMDSAMQVIAQAHQKKPGI
jgi:prepilin-type processing-associated H-X9-DG protein